MQHLILILVDSEMVNKSQASLEADANRYSSELSKEYGGQVENNVIQLTVPGFDVAEQDTIGDMVAELQEAIQDTKDEEYAEENACSECGELDCDCEDDDEEEED